MDLRRTFPSVCLVLAGAWAQSAQASPSGPVIALHAKAHTTKGGAICSTWAPNDIDCTEFTTAARTGMPYDVYIVGVNPLVGAHESVPSLAAMRWAIDYDGEHQRGVDVFSWTFCGDLEFPEDEWPGPRWGNTLSWDVTNHCQNKQPGASGAQGIAGALYVYAYSDDILSVSPWYSWLTDEKGNWVGWMDPELQIANCSPQAIFLDLETSRGAVKFSASATESGFNPCTGEGILPPYGPPDPPITPPPPPPPPQDQKATILLHVALAGSRGGTCTDAPSELDSVKTSVPFGGPGTLYDVFLLATPQVPDDPVGIVALAMGIQYSSSLQVQSWISCDAQLPSDDWPASGSGNKILFAGCESGEIEVGGYFQVAIYDPSYFRIVGHPQTGLAQWASCTTGDTVFEDLSAGRVGWVSLGGAAIGQDTDGCNPALESCTPGPVHAHQTTWGRLKSKY